jgi:hypothetical protein
MSTINPAISLNRPMGIRAPTPEELRSIAKNIAQEAVTSGTLEPVEGKKLEWLLATNPETTPMSDEPGGGGRFWAHSFVIIGRDIYVRDDTNVRLPLVPAEHPDWYKAGTLPMF